MFELSRVNAKNSIAKRLSDAVATTHVTTKTAGIHTVNSFLYRSSKKQDANIEYLILDLPWRTSIYEHSQNELYSKVPISV